MNVYEIVTSEILKQLEAGVIPWHKSWTTKAPTNLITQKPYNGINVFLLSMLGYPSQYWLSYNQCAKLGGTIRKGERASMIVYWNVGQKKLDVKTGKMRTPFILRYYRVFNLSQTEGIQHKLAIENKVPVPDIAECEKLVTDMPNAPKIETSDAAWYRPSSDTVGVPDKTAFKSSEEYYSTLFHELTHSTGHKTRLNREGVDKLPSFGSESYSKEELIAEMGSAMLCGITGISPAVIKNSASYLKHWIDVLRGDSKLLVSAASQAQKASDYIRGVARSQAITDTQATE
jgi:antirestriction protein ArdC